MIAWFSQRITVDDESEYGKLFERRKSGDSWAYRPRQSARPSPDPKGNMVLLQLMLKREYFLAILDGTKKKEFRDKTDFWERQLKRKPYTHIRFRNGYAKVAPEMTVELKRITKRDSCYELHLGKIVDKQNISLLEEPQSVE